MKTKTGADIEREQKAFDEYVERFIECKAALGDFISRSAIDLFIRLTTDPDAHLGGVRD